MRGYLLAAMCLAALSANATVLTFDIDGMSSGNVMPQGYGDNVDAADMGSFHYDVGNGLTEDITVAYEGISTSGGIQDLNWWNTGYSDLTKVCEYEPDGDPGFRIVLTSTAGNVLLDQFDVGNFAGTIIIPSVKIKDGFGNVLYQLDNWQLSGSTFPHQTFTFQGPLSAQQISIEFDLTGLGGASDNVGIDNIRFRQDAVPEPATLALLAGIGAAVLRRRKS